jgi:endonuclease YncB( thermonuclease family)
MGIPYLKPRHLSENMKGRPAQPFFVRPEDYRVVDGDTIAVLAPLPPDAERGVIDDIENGGREPYRPTAFRIRLRAVNAPEMPVKGDSDDLLAGIGIDAHRGHAGLAAKAALAHMIKGRVLHCEPDGQDPYKRLLCDVTASGVKDDLFHVDRAFSVEWRLFDLGMAQGMSGVGRLPARHPDLGNDTLPQSTVMRPSM